MKQFSKLLCAWAVSTALLTSYQKKDTVGSVTASVPAVRDIWTKEQANQWYAQVGWLRGSDFIPSTAINQLEM